MGFKREWQWAITCDECGQTAGIAAMLHFQQALQEARGSGWRIGKKTTCPDCWDKRKSCPKPPVEEKAK